LQTLWTTLKPNGHLLYATCSVLPQENSDQIKAFVQNRDDVEVIQVTPDKVENLTEFGWQILPGQFGMDGFYYCLLKKLC
jgi:16S rRNA (cytosine967-C5)-methyltransferase